MRRWDDLQHDEVGNGKLTHVKQGADSLLEHVGAEGREDVGSGNGRCGRVLCSGALGASGSSTGSGRVKSSVASLVGSDEVSVVLLHGAAEHFEGHNEKDDANARSGEHAVGGDSP